MSSASIQFLHKERLPASGCLVIPGRLDHEMLPHFEKLFSGHKITWLVEETALYDPAVRAYLERSGSGAMFSQSDAAPAAAGEQLKPYLDGGGVLIFVPGRATARKATPCHIPAAQLKVLCAFGLPVLPVAIDCPRESRLSSERAAALPSAVICLGKPIDAARVSIATYRQALLEANEEAYSSRALFKSSLAMALLGGLKRNGSRYRILDGSDDSELPFGHVLATAIVFSKFIREETDKPRVAIVLPPGKGGLIANLAVVLAGKVPVNLNFTAGPEAIKSCIRQADVDRFITADPFVRKVSSFPWPPNRDLIFIERVLPTLKSRIVKWAVISKILPAAALGILLGLHKRSGEDEAALLFTSGSSGEPKGVVLSHRNLLANVCQFGSRLDLPRDSSILGCLPLFHSFGCTVTLWYPMIEGVNLITYPSPLETKRLAELVALHQIDVFLSTPTFLRGYMKRTDPAQFASLKLVVTGAEKLPQSLADAFEQRFGVRPQEGYGLTETSPATNVNLPDPEPQRDSIALPSSRHGSVGQLLPGMAIRITDPATDKEVPIDRQGIIWFKGSNVFGGYLNDPKRSAEVLKDGWFHTGDVGRVDDDGFLYIEGRISRFSKIAGEMVPHETVEAAINRVLGLDGESERRIAVVGIPDEQKGEAILLLSTIAGPALEQECIDLRYKLLDDGISSLWCPKSIVPVAEIPVLASGKLDIKGCEQLARQTRDPSRLRASFAATAAIPIHFPMPNRIDSTFARLRESGQKAFVAYVAAGDPDFETSLDVIRGLADAGADIIELGLPFSDPLADGIVNQLAADRALKAGMTTRRSLELIRRFRASHGTPIVLFTYLNPVFTYGFEDFHRDAAAAGADGILLLDLPPDEAALNEDLAVGAGLKHIRLIAPTTPAERVETLARSAEGFIYALSRTGVTGAHGGPSADIAAFVSSIKAHTDVPVCVGFGISTPEQAAMVAESADGVVVGSAIVKRIELEPSNAAHAVRDFVKPLIDAAHAAGAASPA